MASVEYVDIGEMLPRRALRQSQRRQVQAEYDSYVSTLAPWLAGKVSLEKGEKMSMVRDRLRSAAKRLNRPIQLRRKGSALYFRLKDEAVAEAPTVPASKPAVPPKRNAASATMTRSRRVIIAAIRCRPRRSD